MADATYDWNALAALKSNDADTACGASCRSMRVYGNGSAARREAAARRRPRRARAHAAGHLYAACSFLVPPSLPSHLLRHHLVNIHVRPKRPLLPVRPLHHGRHLPLKMIEQEDLGGGGAGGRATEGGQRGTPRSRKAHLSKAAAAPAHRQLTMSPCCTPSAARVAPLSSRSVNPAASLAVSCGWGRGGGGGNVGGRGAGGPAIAADTLPAPCSSGSSRWCMCTQHRQVRQSAGPQPKAAAAAAPGPGSWTAAYPPAAPPASPGWPASARPPWRRRPPRCAPGHPCGWSSGAGVSPVAGRRRRRRQGGQTASQRLPGPQPDDHGAAAAPAALALRAGRREGAQEAERRVGLGPEVISCMDGPTIACSDRLKAGWPGAAGALPPLRVGCIFRAPLKGHSAFSSSCRLVCSPCHPFSSTPAPADTPAQRPRLPPELASPHSPQLLSWCAATVRSRSPPRRRACAPAPRAQVARRRANRPPPAVQPALPAMADQTIAYTEKYYVSGARVQALPRGLALSCSAAAPVAHWPCPCPLPCSSRMLTAGRRGLRVQARRISNQGHALA